MSDSATPRGGNHNDNHPIPEINREEILKQIFGDVGELIDDFSCAVESTVLLHGRMYITTKYICFYSNLFGLEKKIRIPYSHIKSISKENTAMVIPNAIAIATGILLLFFLSVFLATSTDKRDYIFRSFWDREDCYRILVTFLEKFRSGGKIEGIPRTQSDAPMMEGMQSSTSTTTDSNYAPGATSLKASPTNNEAGNTLSMKRTSVATSRPVSLAAEQSNDDVIDAESGPKVERPGSTVVDMATVFQAELTKARFKITVISGVMDVSLKDFMALFVDETAPFSYRKYHESVKDTNLVASSWEEIPAALSFNREIKFFKPVNLPGLASTRGVKIQKYRKFGDHGLLLWSSTRLEDVPAADTFSVDDLLAVNVVSEKSVNVEISFQVTFLKGTFLKSIIESSTNSEMKKWLETFFNHLKKTTEAFRDGKISLDNPGVVEAPVAEEAPPQPAPVETKPSVQNDSLFGLLLGFNNETLGDRIKAIVLVLVIVFIVYHHLSYRNIYKKLSNYEEKMKILEGLLQQALQKNSASIP